MRHNKLLHLALGFLITAQFSLASTSTPMVVLDQNNQTTLKLQYKNIDPSKLKLGGFLDGLDELQGIELPDPGSSQTQTPTPIKPKLQPAPRISVTAPASAINQTSSISVANVGEYSCPLFENQPFQNLNAAILNLTSAVGNTPECKDKDTVQSVQKNTQTIQDSIKALQGFIDPSIDISSIDPSIVSQNTQSAILGVKNLADIFGNKSLLNSQCGQKLVSTGAVLSSLNDLVANIAPFALLAASLTPTVGLPVKVAILGTIFASNTVTSMANIITSSSPDMSKPDQRRAILQNVCAFSKVYRQVEFMSLAKSGQFSKITNALNKDLTQVRMATTVPSEKLIFLLNEKAKEEQNLTEVEALSNDLKKMIKELSDQAKSNSNKGRNFFLCMKGQQLIETSESSLRATIKINSLIEQTKAFATASQQQDLSAHKMAISMITNEVKKRSSKNNINDIEACSKASINLVDSLFDATMFASHILNGKRKLIEEKYLKNSEYKFMKSNLQNLQFEESTNIRLTKVLEDLAKDDTAINRSELDINMSTLQQALFGSSTSFTDNSPVRAWLNFIMNTHETALLEFNEGFNRIKNSAFQLTITGAGRLHEIKGGPSVIDRQTLSDIKLSNSLGTLNKDSLPAGSRGHQMVCQDLKAAWRKWSASLDHLAAAQFMCDMIDDIKDFTINQNIKQICVGNKNYFQANIKIDPSKRQNIPLSSLEAKKIKLIEKRADLGQMSYQSASLMLRNKIEELNCSMPEPKVMKTTSISK